MGVEAKRVSLSIGWRMRRWPSTSLDAGLKWLVGWYGMVSAPFITRAKPDSMPIRGSGSEELKMALLYLSIWLYTYKLWRLLQLNHPSPAQLLQNPFTRQTTSHLPILHFPPQLSNFPHLYKSQSPMSVSQPRWSLFSLTRHPP